MIRLNKYLASLGLASRRKIDQFIVDKRVLVNGKIATLGQKVDPSIDQIKVNNRLINSVKLDFEYIVLNKPLEVLSTTKDDWNRTTVMDLVDTKNRLYPVGRLDYNSTGLILLTNDGDLAQKLTHPRYHLPKTYLVKLDHLPTPSQLKMLRSGMTLDGRRLQKAEVVVLNSPKHILKITLYQGIKRQIRKMTKKLNLGLLSLHRVSIGPIHIGQLQPGHWRYLTPQEIAKLK